MAGSDTGGGLCQLVVDAYPLGFGLLSNHPDADLTFAWLQPCLKDSRIFCDLAADRGVRRENLCRPS